MCAWCLNIHLDSTGDIQDELIEWSLIEPDDEDALPVALVEWSLVEPIDEISIHHSIEDEGDWTIVTDSEQD